MRGVCLGVLLMAAGPLAAATSSVYACAEQQSCDVGGQCLDGGTRVVLNLLRARDGSERILGMGPMVREAGGGLFYETTWRRVEERPAFDGSFERGNWFYWPGAEQPRAFVARPGREVRGFARDARVMTEFNCEQVMF